MSGRKTISEVLQSIDAALDKGRKARVVAALREAADLLEKDSRPFEEAASAIFARVTANLAGAASRLCEAAATNEVRALIRDAKRLLVEQEDL